MELLRIVIWHGCVAGWRGEVVVVVDVYAVYVLLDGLVVVFLVGLGRGLGHVRVDGFWGRD